MTDHDETYHAAHEAAYQLLKEQLFTFASYAEQGHEGMGEPGAAALLIEDQSALDAAVMVVWRLLKDDYPVARSRGRRRPAVR